MRTLIAVIMLFAGTLNAQELPSKPVANKEFIIEAAAAGTALALDLDSTARNFSRCSTCYELSWPMRGERSVPKIAVSITAFDAAAVFASYEWKKHVKNKYLNPLWRVPLLALMAVHARSAAINYGATVQTTSGR